MLIYFIIFAFLAFSTIIRFKYAYLFLLIFAMIAGTRYECGGDFYGYKDYFDIVVSLYESGNLFTQITKYNIEFIFTGINLLVYFSGLDFFYVFLIVGFLSNFYLYKILKIYKKNDVDINIFIITYFAFIFFIHQMWYIRQSLSMILTIYGFFLLFEKKYLKFIIYLIVATSVHFSSSMVIIPILIISYMIKNTKILRFFLVFLIITGVIIVSFNVHVMEHIVKISDFILAPGINFVRYYAYESQWSGQAVERVGLLQIFVVFLSIYVLAFKKLYYLANKFNKFNIILMVFYIFFSFLFYELEIAHRINCSLLFGLCLFLANEHNIIKQNFVFRFFIILFSFMYLIRFLILNDFSYELFKTYQSFLFI